MASVMVIPTEYDSHRPRAASQLRVGTRPGGGGGGTGTSFENTGDVSIPDNGPAVTWKLTFP
ncbi:hypothetical protein OG747_35180 [Streptomyces sp. NBC_01384]|uniref:hypothetical protein n=1 Tax=Streptomyces sp. NBC_01384 TaxID=2903847 RepID=UPI00324D5B16